MARWPAVGYGVEMRTGRALVCACVVGLFCGGASPAADIARSEATEPNVEPNVTPQDPAPSPTPIVPSMSVVEVRSDPPGARVLTHDGRDLGRTPVFVSVDPSEPLNVQLSASGHVTTDVSLDGRQTTFDVQLRRRAGGGRPSMVNNTTSTDTPQSGNGSMTRPPDGPIRDPWM